MALELFGLPSADYDLDHAGGILALIVALLLVGGFVYGAARLTQSKTGAHQAIVAGSMGFLAMQLGYELADKFTLVGMLLGLAAFCGVIAVVLRVKYTQGMAIGGLAWVVGIVATIALGYVQDHWVA